MRRDDVDRAPDRDRRKERDPGQDGIPLPPDELPKPPVEDPPVDIDDPSRYIVQEFREISTTNSLGSGHYGLEIVEGVEWPIYLEY